MPHRERPEHAPNQPVWVILRSAYQPLRSRSIFPKIRDAIALASRQFPDFRVVEFSVRQGELHLIVEAADHEALGSGMRGVTIRIARNVNAHLGRSGQMWPERWEGRPLGSPKAVREALVALFALPPKGVPRSGLRVDPYSSAPYFTGFVEYSGTSPLLCAGRAAPRALVSREVPTLPARTALLRSGWLKLGLIALSELGESG